MRLWQRRRKRHRARAGSRNTGSIVGPVVPGMQAMTISGTKDSIFRAKIKSDRNLKNLLSDISVNSIITDELALAVAAA